MASQFKLVPEPTFKSKVSIPRAGQEAGMIELTYNHKNTAELTKLENDLKDKSMINYVMIFVSAWNLEDDFNQENVQILLDNYPAAAPAIIENYYKELLGQREKNS